MKGDGNCFFRSLSHVLAGKQTLHVPMRAMLVSYLKENMQKCPQLGYNEAHLEAMAEKGELDWIALYVFNDATHTACSISLPTKSNIFIWLSCLTFTIKTF